MVTIDTWPPTTQSQQQTSGPRFQDLVETDARVEEEKEEGMDLGGGFGEGSTGDEYLMQLLWPG